MIPWFYNHSVACNNSRKLIIHLFRAIMLSLFPICSLDKHASTCHFSLHWQAALTSTPLVPSTKCFLIFMEKWVLIAPALEVHFCYSAKILPLHLPHPLPKDSLHSCGSHPTWWCWQREESRSETQELHCDSVILVSFLLQTDPFNLLYRQQD